MSDDRGLWSIPGMVVTFVWYERLLCHVTGKGVFFLPGLNRSELESDESTSSAVEVRSAWR